MLVASAALSLAAPLATQASSVNLDDMKSYSNSSNTSSFTNDFLNIEPGDFIHQSINDLANSRGCSVDITGRSISRYEAATIVNSCLGDVAEVSTIERSLIDEFSSELALIRGRLDGIEARLNEFEAGAFSSTTVMDGKVVFALMGVNGNDDWSALETTTMGGTWTQNEKVTAAYVYQMNLNTSFTGDDNLYVRLKAENGWVNMRSKPGNYHNEAGGSENGSVRVDKIWYTFPLGERWEATIGPRIENYYMLAATPSVYKPKVLKAFRFAGHGAAFGATTSTGLGIKYVGDQGFATSLTVNSEGGDDSNGFLTEEDSNKVNLQAAYTKDNYHLSATYTTQSGGALDWDEWHYYSTQNLDQTFDEADGFALRGWWRPDETGTVVPSVSIGYDTMTFSNPGNGYTDASGYAVGLNWSDTFQAGDTVGIAFGQPLKGTDKTSEAIADDVDPFLWEAYYSFKPNDSIEITPGIFGGSDVYSTTDHDVFGAVVTSTFRF